jgi:kynurenine 3-monooxygenase
MRIAIIGSTSGTGLRAVEAALDAGHTVSAFARTPSKLGDLEARVEVHQGDVLTSADALDACVKGADGVIVSLSAGALGHQTIREEGTKRVMEAMERVGARRIVIVSSLGAGDSGTLAMLGAAGLTFVKTVIRQPIADHDRQEAAVRATGLDWTIARPGGLTDEPGTGSWRTDGEGAGRIPRADVAAAILSWIEEGEHIGEALPLKG